MRHGAAVSKPALVSGNATSSLSLVPACRRLRCWLNSARASSTVLSARLNSLCRSSGFQALWIDRFEQLEVLAKTFARRPQLLDFLLRVVGLALQNNERSRQLVRHLGPSVFQFSLTPAEFLELAFLFFNLFLLALELEQLFVRFLHLGVEMLGADPDLLR